MGLVLFNIVFLLTTVASSTLPECLTATPSSRHTGGWDVIQRDTWTGLGGGPV